MTTQQSLEYAQHRLALARIMKDQLEIVKWAEHVDYWKKQTESKAGK